MIKIKQLLSLDIINADQYVEGGVNPQDPSLVVKDEGGGEGLGLDLQGFVWSPSQVEAIR